MMPLWVLAVVTRRHMQWKGILAGKIIFSRDPHAALARQYAVVDTTRSGRTATPQWSGKTMLEPGGLIASGLW